LSRKLDKHLLFKSRALLQIFFSTFYAVRTSTQQLTVDIWLPHCSILKRLKDDVDVHLLQGTIFEARGQLLEAVQSYDIAMGLEPQSTRPIISSGASRSGIRVSSGRIRTLPQKNALHPGFEKKKKYPFLSPQP
jgi:hypothetical protein